jgi:gamma-glutamyltranspeptidase/glutathione hydrolase
MSRFSSSLLVVFIMATLFGVSLPPQTSRADTFRPVVRGRRGVVAGGHPLTVAAGLRILQQGGNAVDAGVATILAASVIEFSHFSFGGEVPILIKLRDTRITPEVVVIEGMGQAPMKATREFFANRAGKSGSGMATMAGAKSGLIPSTGRPDGHRVQLREWRFVRRR